MNEEEYQKEKIQFMKDVIKEYISMFFTVSSVLLINIVLNNSKTLIPEGQNNYLIVMIFIAILTGLIPIKFYDRIFKEKQVKKKKK
jgi:hypothetical protein